MKVLFVCVQNINRSQIAEAIFNKLSKKNKATSAGIRPRSPGMPLKEEHNNPVIPMREAGYNLSGSKIKGLNSRITKSADKVVFIFNRRKHEKEIPAYLKKFPNKEFWEVESISDNLPFEEYCRLEKKRIRKIRRYVKELVKRVG